MKNVILITIDGVSYRSTGLSGLTPSPTPTIDKLAEDGLSLENCYSTGSVTQFSFPSIMSSTLPLDYGGYDRGVLDRPVCLAEVFRENGYYTGAFTTTSWLGRQFGYDRGFLDYHEMFDIFNHHLSGFIKNYLNYYSREFSKRNHKINVADTHLIPFLERFFENLIIHCQNKISEKSSKYIHNSPVIHNVDFSNVMDIIREERTNLEDSPSDYIHNLIDGDSNEFIPELKMEESQYIPTYTIPKQFIVKNSISYVQSNLSNFAKYDLTNPYRYAHILYNIYEKVMYGQQTKVPSSKYIIDNSTNWISNVADRPFFLWMHLSDVHDESFVSWEYSHEKIKKEIGEAGEHKSKIIDEGDWEGNLLNDYALHYVDNQITALVSKLRDLSLFDDTVIAVTADHGRHRADRPFRSYPDIDDFHDEIHHVPVIIHNAGLRKEVSELCSSIDIAPILLESVGLEIPKEFKGNVLTGNQGSTRDYILMEDAGSGPCDLDHKFINIGVRTNTEKLVRQQGEIKGFWNCTSDKYEINNTSDKSSTKNEIPNELDNILRERINEIRDLNRKNTRILPGMRPKIRND